MTAINSPYPRYEDIQKNYLNRIGDDGHNELVEETIKAAENGIPVIAHGHMIVLTREQTEKFKQAYDRLKEYGQVCFLLCFSHKNLRNSWYEEPNTDDGLMIELFNSCGFVGKYVFNRNVSEEEYKGSEAQRLHIKREDLFSVWYKIVC